VIALACGGRIVVVGGGGVDQRRIWQPAPGHEGRQPIGQRECGAVEDDDVPRLRCRAARSRAWRRGTSSHRRATFEPRQRRNEDPCRLRTRPPVARAPIARTPLRPCCRCRPRRRRVPQSGRGTIGDGSGGRPSLSPSWRRTWQAMHQTLTGGGVPSLSRRVSHDPHRRSSTWITPPLGPVASRMRTTAQTEGLRRAPTDHKPTSSRTFESRPLGL
jgi:hypothetical protein